jgi:uncharacterized short protein YbdD (DUF466 family)
MNREFDIPVNGAKNSGLKRATSLKRESRIQAAIGCWKRAVQMARASIGVPDYDTYVAHVREHHPERKPMSYEAFFVERQNARYKSGGGRCC